METDGGHSNIPWVSCAPIPAGVVCSCCESCAGVEHVVCMTEGALRVGSWSCQALGPLQKLKGAGGGGALRNSRSASGWGEFTVRVGQCCWFNNEAPICCKPSCCCLDVRASLVFLEPKLQAWVLVSLLGPLDHDAWVLCRWRVSLFL